MIKTTKREEEEEMMLIVKNLSISSKYYALWIISICHELIVRFINSINYSKRIGGVESSANRQLSDVHRILYH